MNQLYFIKNCKNRILIKYIISIRDGDDVFLFQYIQYLNYTKYNIAFLFNVFL